MIVKVFLTLNIDEDEYPVPVDYDIDGMSIKAIKIITE
jgi:hypothetical protein